MEPYSVSLLTLAGLGAFHGLNPSMGWLFAVALGMQEGKRSAVWRALVPLTLGHGLAIAAAIAEHHGGCLHAAPSDGGARLMLDMPAAHEPVVA